jgi:acyl-CoA thioester hydrolase
MNDADQFTPPAHAFVRRFPVADRDIDVLGHLNNVVIVQWVQDMAVGHSDALGLDLGWYHRMGTVWVVKRHDIEYLAPGYLGEQIRATTWVANIGSSSSLRRTLFHREPDEKLLARAETTWVLVDRTGRPTRVSDEIRNVFEPGA